jgi:hypothetical protein
VQVMQPPPAPDPVGLAAALKLLGQPDIFRDMSGVTALSDLLSGLSSGAIDLARAQTLANKAGQALAGSGTAGAPADRALRAAPSEPDAGQQVDKLNAIKYARDQGLIDDQAASDAAEGVLGGDLLASADAGVPTDDKAPGRPPEQPILDEVSKRPRLKESFDALINAGFKLRLTRLAGGTFKVVLDRRLLLIKDIDVTYTTSADWVEAAAKRAYQLDEDLRRGAIRDKALVIWGTAGLTDLEKMARVYEWSVWFWQYPTLGGSDVVEGLMGDMMVVLTDLTESANPLSGNDGRFHIFRLGASAQSSGFKRMFRDAFNQVRHATGSLQVSLLYGKVGFESAQSREDDNTADCRLNIACKALADDLKSAAPNFKVENIGDILRRELGDPAQTAPWPRSLPNGDPTPPCKT